MKKIHFSFLCLFLLSVEVFAFAETNSAVKQTVITNGIGLGTVVAAVTSWARNRSVLWMIVHGIFSWLYVIYFVFTRKESERK
jgi:hypothetical protein